METNERVKSLMKEISKYKDAQRDVESALSSAEMELDAVLDEEFRNKLVD